MCNYIVCIDCIGTESDRPRSRVTCDFVDIVVVIGQRAQQFMQVLMFCDVVGLSDWWVARDVTALSTLPPDTCIVEEFESTFDGMSSALDSVSRATSGFLTPGEQTELAIVIPNDLANKSTYLGSAS